MLKTITVYDFFCLSVNVIYLINFSFSQVNPFLNDESELVYPNPGQKTYF